MELFKLFGSILVDTDKAEDSLHKTDSKAEKLGSTLLKGAEKAGKFALGLGTAAAGAATALTKMASDASANMDVIDKASQRMNVSAESYQELAHAAGLSGVEMSTMEMAARKLEGTGLGLDEALDQIYAFESAEERSAAAAELFGDRVAYQLSPMLNASAEDMAAMKQEAHDLGLVFDQETVTAGAALNDALGNVKDAVGALGTGLGTQLMPIVTEACNLILQFMPQIQEVLGRIGPILTETLSTIMPILMDAVTSILPPLIQLLEPLLPLFTLLCETLLPILAGFIEMIANLLSKVVIPVVQFFVEVIKGAVEGVIGFFKNFRQNMENIWNAIVETFKKPINAVISFINKLVSGVTTGINTIIRAMNQLKWEIPDWVPLLGGKTFGFDIAELTAPQIPLLAEGGTLTSSGSVIVGERGPELLSLPSGASVNPLSEGSDIAMLRNEVAQLREDILWAMNHRTIEWNDRELGRLVKTYA